MNKVFRLIWSTICQCWVVASEKVTGKGGIPARTVCSLAAAVLLACGSAAYALPSGNTLVAGQATVESPTAGQMQITQTSNRAIINWQSFGIASGEAVNITQPSAQAALLNRVVGNSSSEIFGKLTANGQVFLVNPNGVLFDRGAEVNVGGLVASSLNITDDNFMNNNLKFFKDGIAGSVSNQGNITAGFAALLGPSVNNSGSIITYKGSTVLGAADAITLNFDPRGLIALKLDQGAYNAQVASSGIIEADGGRVLLTAKSADSILKSMVNNSGVIRARSVDSSSGTILLLGDMENGTVSVGGTLDASAPNGGNGGFVETSAAHVKIADNTRVTTLAANGQNGTWLIDPDGFTIAASGGDMTGAAVASALAGGNFSIASTSGSGADGNINVNDAISWSANKLTLTATNDINVNAVMTASGTSSLDLEPGSGKVNMGLNSSGFYGRVDFPGRSGTGFLTIGGLGYTVLSNQVGTPGSITSTDLQGMSINAAALTHHYALGSNIDANSTSSWPGGAGFQPVGNDTTKFTGSFDGLGHTISGLFINRPTTDNVGLFGYADVGSVMRNVGLVNATVTGQASVGILVGVNQGSVYNSYAAGVVNGNSYNVGGLVGTNGGNGSISYSYATSQVTGSDGAVGGLAGVNGGSISYSYATGDVIGTGDNMWIGGLTGLMAGDTTVISHSYATGNVIGAGTDSWIGGLVGRNSGSFPNSVTISDSYATGAVTGNGEFSYVGGLVGENGCRIERVYATGAVDGTGSNSFIGGLTGQNGGRITNAYAAGNVNGTDCMSCNIGGLVGENNSTVGNGIFNSYATGSVTESGASFGNTLGGLVASVSDGTISSSFWNTDAYAVDNGLGTGKSAVALKTLSTFSAWDIANTGGSSSVWRVYDGYSMPLLRGFLTPLTVTANSASKTYNGLAYSGGNGVSYSVAGASLSGVATYSGSSQGAINAASYIITPGGLYSNQQGYDISYANGALTVDKADLTITANNASKTYGQTTSFAGTEFTPVGLQNGETIGSVTLSSTGAAATATVAGGPYSITPSNATGGTFSAGNYTISYANGSLTVTPAELTVTGAVAQNKVYDGTTAAVINGATLSGVIGADVVTVSGGGSFVDKNVANDIGVTSALNLGGAGAGNYSLTQPTGLTATISPADLTITGNNASKTYGQTTSFAGTEFTPVGLQNGETIGSVTLSSAGAAATATVAGGPYSIVPSNATGGTFTAGNYTISYTNGSLTVSPASLTVTANNASKTYGQTTAFTGTEFTPVGLQNGETIGSVMLSSPGAAATAPVAGGPYSITLSNATGGTFTAGNYTISYANGSLTVSPASLTVAANNAGKTYDGLAYSGGNGVSYTGFVNSETSAVLGGTLAYSGSGQGAINAGSYSIIPSGLTSGNYDISYTNGTLAVDKASLSITANNASKIYGQTTSFAGSEFTNSGLQNSETIGSVSLASAGAAATAGVVGSPYSITPSNATGGTFDVGNYTVAYNNGQLTVTPKTLTITGAVAQNKVYNGTTNATISGAILNGVVGTDVVTVSGGGSFADKNVANGIGVTADFGLSGVAAANYSVVQPLGLTADITPAPLTVIANNDSKAYSGTAYTGGNGVSYNSFVNDETAAVLGGSLNYSGSSQGALNTGSYVITPGGLTSGNYTLHFVDGTLTINPAAAPSTASSTTGPGNLRDQLALLQSSLNQGNSPTQTDLLRLQMLESKRGEINNMLGSVSKDLIVIINGGIRR